MYSEEREKVLKVSSVFNGKKKPGFKRYRQLYYGKSSLCHVLWAEFVFGAFGAVPGALGLFLRSKFYKPLFKNMGKGVLIGRNVTFRHPNKIELGRNVVIDDYCVVDAKGRDNSGIVIEDNVFVGRNTIVYCKNGDIRIGAHCSISSLCTIFSCNKLTMGPGTMVGGYCYILSGGEYDYDNRDVAFADQSGSTSKGELTIGRNCWLGARSTILDGASLGEHCVIGAGAVVTRPVAPDSLAVGVPAKVVKSI